MTLEQAEDMLEKVLIQVPTVVLISNPYMAGYIDCMYDCKLITDEIRGFLYMKYGEGYGPELEIKVD